MTIKEIKLRPIKVKVNINGYDRVEGLLVVGKDNRLFFIHNNSGPSGDWAGDIVHAYGYTMSWCMLKSEEEDCEIDLSKLAWTLLSADASNIVDLSFKKSKRFEL